MTKWLTLSAAALLAAGCSSSATKLREGQWDMGIEVTSLDAPGVPEGIKQQMRARMPSQHRSQCFRTSGDDAETLRQMRESFVNGFTRQAAGSNCSFDNDDKVSGGQIKLGATCTSPGNVATARFNMTGAYEAEQLNSDFGFDIEGRLPGSAQPITIHIAGRVIGRRTGDCA